MGKESREIKVPYVAPIVSAFHGLRVSGEAETAETSVSCEVCLTVKNDNAITPQDLKSKQVA